MSPGTGQVHDRKGFTVNNTTEYTCAWRRRDGMRGARRGARAAGGAALVSLLLAVFPALVGAADATTASPTVTTNGGVAAFGDAVWPGELSGVPAAPIVAM